MMHISLGLGTICIAITIAAGCSGACGTAVDITCKDGCNIQSIPADECYD